MQDLFFKRRPRVGYALAFALGILGASAIWFLATLIHRERDQTVEEFRAMDPGARERAYSDMTTKDPVSAWNFLKEAAIEDEVTVLNVHTLAHRAGSGLYKTFGIAGVGYCDDSFVYGCIHGVSEAFFAESDGPASANAIAKACVDFVATNGGPESTTFGCIHGIGHGLATWLSHDASAAVAYCDTFSEDVRTHCYDGVFMEIFENAERTPLDENGLWQTCAPFEGIARERCAHRHLMGVFTDGSDEDFRSAFAICHNAPSADLEEICVRSLGTRASQFALGDITEIRHICALDLERLSERACHYGAVGELLRQRYPKYETTIEELCMDLDGQSIPPACTRAE